MPSEAAEKADEIAFQKAINRVGLTRWEKAEMERLREAGFSTAQAGARVGCSILYNTRLATDTKKAINRSHAVVRRLLDLVGAPRGA